MVEGDEYLGTTDVLERNFIVLLTALQQPRIGKQLNHLFYTVELQDSSCRYAASHHEKRNWKHKQLCQGRGLEDDPRGSLGDELFGGFVLLTRRVSIYYFLVRLSIYRFLGTLILIFGSNRMKMIFWNHEGHYKIIRWTDKLQKLISAQYKQSIYSQFQQIYFQHYNHVINMTIFTTLIIFIFPCFGKEEGRRDSRTKYRKLWKFHSIKQTGMLLAKMTRNLYPSITTATTKTEHPFKTTTNPKTTPQSNKMRPSFSRLMHFLLRAESDRYKQYQVIRVFAVQYSWLGLCLQDYLLMQKNTIGDYTLLQSQMIGAGSYSKVYLGQNSRGKKAAIKKVKKTSKDLTSYRLAKSEAKILYGLRSPHICELITTYQEENYYYLVQRYYEGKTVADLLKGKKKISYGDCLHIFKAIVKSLQYLIDHKVMHRDLKPENVICYHDRTIIIDFGFACKFEKKYQKKFTQKVGTPIYMSPQLLMGNNYNTKSDIWSLGVILFEMIHGYPPFTGKKESQILENILTTQQVEFKEKLITSQVKQLISSCLRRDIDKRLKWQQLFGWRQFAKTGEMACQVSTTCCLFG